MLPSRYRDSQKQSLKGFVIGWHWSNMTSLSMPLPTILGLEYSSHQLKEASFFRRTARVSALHPTCMPVEVACILMQSVPRYSTVGRG